MPAGRISKQTVCDPKCQVSPEMEDLEIQYDTFHTHHPLMDIALCL